MERKRYNLNGIWIECQYLNVDTDGEPQLPDFQSIK